MAVIPLTYSKDEVLDDEKSTPFYIEDQVAPVSWMELCRNIGYGTLYVLSACGCVAFSTMIPLKDPNDPSLGVDFGYHFGWLFLLSIVSSANVFVQLLIWFPYLKEQYWRTAIPFCVYTIIPVLFGIPLQKSRIPFNLLITVSISFPALIVISWIIWGSKLKDPVVRKDLYVYIKMSCVPAAFFVICLVYIVCFSFARSTPLQIFINVFFAVSKYVFKRTLFRAFYKKGGPVAANYVSFFMETLHQLFGCLIFLSRATLFTIVFNIGLESLTYVRSAAGTTKFYQQFKSSVISRVRLEKVDRFLSNQMFPTTDLLVSHQQILQTNWLCMTCYANVLTLVGGSLCIILPRLSPTNSAFYPFGDRNLAQVGGLFGTTPFQGAMILVCGTQGILLFLGIVLLVWIKIRNGLHTVTSSLRLFSEFKLLCLVGTSMIFAFPLGYLLFHNRTFSFVFPENYTE